MAKKNIHRNTNVFFFVLWMGMWFNVPNWGYLSLGWRVGNRAQWDNIAGGLPGEEYGGGLRAVCFTGYSWKGSKETQGKNRAQVGMDGWCGWLSCFSQWNLKQSLSWWDNSCGNVCITWKPAYATLHWNINGYFKTFFFFVYSGHWCVQVNTHGCSSEWMMLWSEISEPTLDL